MKLILITLLVFCLAILVQGEMSKADCLKKHAAEMGSIKVKAAELFKKCKDTEDKDCFIKGVRETLKLAKEALHDCFNGVKKE